jgi:hypothetical protein
LLMILPATGHIHLPGSALRDGTGFEVLAGAGLVAAGGALVTTAGAGVDSAFLGGTSTVVLVEFFDGAAVTTVRPPPDRVVVPEGELPVELKRNSWSG